jgi:protein NrfC
MKIPVSQGYIVVDFKKCIGCLACMMACSLAHEGKVNLSSSRIQVINDPYGRFPDDIAQKQCLQCVVPPCVFACPTGALHPDPEKGVRIIDEEKCSFCLLCMKACRNVPSMIIPNFEKRVAQKCDLCMNTPFWNGGGNGEWRQVCIEVCPVKAIKFVKDVPNQLDNTGYYVNLRTRRWKELGLGPEE